ncbi:Target of rapamycin complex 2 subunit AVO2 [Golovinomyces cichoracearum]|uniref:Target of rapamycin complex 2 subunit AVO2 n=1 Tax=Golovinomyces cichoracearum TaxID=62708 RepID=A0A420I2P2_9PEZI|nr:Target of rapamycin complex 2 subunit AVO2 [Golovinomyces cichoracearum]
MIEPEVRLRRAIHAQDTSLVARIIKSHPHLLRNPDTSSPTTHTPSGLSNTSLHLASSINCLPICKLLLDLGHEGSSKVPQTSLNENYETPLHLAAREGHSEVVHLLCERCPTCILRRDIRGKNALMVAAIGGHDTVLQILLTFAPGRHDGGEEDTKKIVDAVDHDGNTALHFATMYGHLPVLRTLLAAGADWEKRNCWSWQPVSYCATVQVEVYYKGLVTEAERKRKFAGEPQNPITGNPVSLVSTGSREEI